MAELKTRTGTLNVTASAIIVQNIFNQLRQEAKALPDFIESMTQFLGELEDYWSHMDQVEDRLEELFKETNQEEVANLNNEANELYIEILRKKIEFQKRWKPSFQMHDSPSRFDKFSELIRELLDNNMLPVSEGLRTALGAREEWIRGRQTDRIERRLRSMTLVLTWVVLAEILIGAASVFPYYRIVLTVTSLMVPVVISVVYWYFTRKITEQKA